MMTGLAIGMGGGWFVALVLLGSVIAIVWYLVMLSRGDRDRDTADPEDYLRERLARGEIDAVEYERVRRLLGK